MTERKLDGGPAWRGPRSPPALPASKGGVVMVRPRERAQGGAESATVDPRDVELAESQGWERER